jgi:hypothetical protein
MKLEYIIEPDSVCQYYRQLIITNIDWPILNECAYIHCNIVYGNLIKNEFTPLNLKMYPDYKIILIIANSTKVNFEGRLENETEKPEECILGEYDFFIMCLNNNVPLSTVLENGINASILRGRHNI